MQLKHLLLKSIENWERDMMSSLWRTHENLETWTRCSIWGGIIQILYKGFRAGLHRLDFINGGKPFVKLGTQTSLLNPIQGKQGHVWGCLIWKMEWLLILLILRRNLILKKFHYDFPAMFFVRNKLMVFSTWLWLVKNTNSCSHQPLLWNPVLAIMFSYFSSWEVCQIGHDRTHSNNQYQTK